MKIKTNQEENKKLLQIIKIMKKIKNQSDSEVLKTLTQNKKLLTNDKNNRILLTSIKIKKSKKIIKKIISLKKDFYKENKIGLTPLLCAIAKDNIKMIKYLIKNEKIDINYKNCYKITPLSLAIYKNDLKIIKILLKNENIHLNNSFKQAIKKNNFKIINLILDLKKFRKNKNILDIVKIICFDKIPNDVYKKLFDFFFFDEFNWNLDFYKQWRKRDKKILYLMSF